MDNTLKIDDVKKRPVRETSDSVDDRRVFTKFFGGKKMETLKRIALGLVIIGALNWGLIGLFEFDLVASIFGGQTAGFSKIIYTLIGLSGLVSLTMLFEPMEDEDAITGDISRTESLSYGTEFGEETDLSNEEKQNRDL